MNPRYLDFASSSPTCANNLCPFQTLSRFCKLYSLAFWTALWRFCSALIYSSQRHPWDERCFSRKGLSYATLPPSPAFACKWTAWAYSYSKGLYDCKLPFFLESASIWWYQNWAPVSPIAMLHSKPLQTTTFLAVVLKLDKDSTLHLLIHRRRFRTLKKIPRREIQILTGISQWHLSNCDCDGALSS